MLSLCYTIVAMARQVFPGITVDAEVRFGKPVIKGTRVPVGVVVGKIAGGMTPEEVMKEYELTRRQVQAALKYAAAVVTQEEVALA